MINYQTKYGFLLFFSIHVYTVSGQQIYFGGGLENAQFKNYEDSFGVNTLSNNDPNSYNLLFEAGYKQTIFHENLSWTVGFSYNNFTIKTGFTNAGIDIPLTYKLTYVSIKPGIYYTIFDRRRFKIQLQAHMSHNWLIKGTSTYSNITNNIYGNNTFDKTLISFHRGINFEYSLTEDMAAYMSYNNAGSFKEENQDSVPGEKYSLNTNALSLGIVYTITNRKRTICYGGF